MIAEVREASATDGGEPKFTEKQLPMLIRNRPEGWYDIKDDDEKYRTDLASRPVTVPLPEALVVHVSQSFTF